MDIWQELLMLSDQHRTNYDPSDRRQKQYLPIITMQTVDTRILRPRTTKVTREAQAASMLWETFMRLR